MVTDSARDLATGDAAQGRHRGPPRGAEARRRGRPRPPERQVIPQSVMQLQLANPFLAPDFSAAERRRADGRLANWELSSPLFRSFETRRRRGRLHGPARGHARSRARQARADAAPGPDDREARRAGHRTFLLADEPGLGKTAQALLAAQAADAFPLLVVVPNVVKTNWAREVESGRRSRRATVIHGDGDDRSTPSPTSSSSTTRCSTGTSAGSAARLQRHGRRRGALHQEQDVAALAARARALRSGSGPRTARPLLMALTGTPLINDIEDFRAIWQFLGWIDDKKPLPRLMGKLEETGLTPADRGFYPAARKRRDRHGHRAAHEGRRRRRHPGPSHRRHAGRARRRGRPLDPRRPSASWPGASSSATTPRSRPVARAPSSTASTTSSSAGSRRGSARSRWTRARRARTSSRWSAGSARPRPASPPTTPPSWRATSARWSSSPSTST